MSQENLDLVAHVLRAFDARDLDAAMPSYTDDVEWRLIGGFADLMGAGGTGHAAVRAAATEWSDLGVRSEVESMRALGDQVLVIGHFVGTGGASGATYRSPRGAQIYTFRDGRISAVDNYYDATEALEAVGLSE